MTKCGVTFYMFYRVYVLKNVFEVLLVLAIFLPMNLFYVLDTTFLGEELCRYVSTLKDTDLDYFPLALYPYNVVKVILTHSRNHLF